MEKEKMSLDQLDSLKIDLEDKLKKLKEELLEVDTEIHWRTIKSKVTVFKEMFESRINQFCKFTRYYDDEEDGDMGSEVITLCKIKEVSYDPEKEDNNVVRIELIACHIFNDWHNKIDLWPDEPDTIHYGELVSGRVDDIIFYESLDEVRMVLKSIVDEQVK